MPRNKVELNKIAEFIELRHPGTDREELHIKFDPLVMYLMKDPRYRFSASKFEKMLVKEVGEKILGRPFTSEVMGKLCIYIEQLAAYLTKEMDDVLAGRVQHLQKPSERRASEKAGR
ncbi:MAG: hypothetical protein D6710_12010 [Nitrospirae bacterium]|nr:MAG: hypothetical protein D6710_12010 [Nitrospirota bacterium]